MEKIRLFVVYEKNRGGETNATESIITSFKKKFQLSVGILQLESLNSTSTKQYFSWIFKSIDQTYEFFKKKKTNTNAVIYTTTFTAGFAAFLHNFKKPVSLVFHYHGNRIPNFTVSITQIFKFFITYTLQMLVFLFAKKIIVTSKYSLNRVSVQFPMIKKEKLVVIENGIDFEKFSKLSKSKNMQLRKKYKLKKNEIVITNVSRLVHTKGIIKLLYVFKRLQKKFQKLHLFLVYPDIKNISESNYKDTVIQVIKSNHIQPVTLIENANMQEIYNISTLIVSFSEEDNYPLILLESYAANAKFVTSNKELLQLQISLAKKSTIQLHWDSVTNQILKHLVTT